MTVECSGTNIVVTTHSRNYKKLRIYKALDNTASKFHKLFYVCISSCQGRCLPCAKSYVNGEKCKQ